MDLGLKGKKAIVTGGKRGLGLATAQMLAKEGCDAIVVLCTNMRGAPVAPRIEPELGIPIYDSVSVTLWQSMRVAGADPRRGLRRRHRRL